MAYQHRPLQRRQLDPDPIVQFQRWFSAAAAAGELAEAAALATSDPESGQPSLRMVLVKGWDHRGFRFFSNYGSRKARELAANPLAALTFYWPALGRQVRIEGAVARLPSSESDAYFASRPRGSQLAAAASQQSRPIASRADLTRRVGALEKRFRDSAVPRPEGWGGMALSPRRYEFWQQGEDRLHDRFLYLPEPGGGWLVERLQP